MTRRGTPPLPMFKAQDLISGSKLQRAWRAYLSLQFENSLPTLEWAAGLRGAVGIAVPAAVGLLLGHFVWGILCSFSTLWVLMCDVGGAYRQKAVTLLASCVTLLIAYIFGGWMILSVPNYIIGLFLWVFVSALIGVAGNGAAQAGTVSSTIVITSVVLFVPSEFWIRMCLWVIGFSWALLLLLGLWPLAPYSPAFVAISASVAQLADLSIAFWAGAAAPGQFPNNLPFAIAYERLMTSLERARDIWGAVRAGRAGPTKRSMALLAVLEQIDDVARSLVTLREELNVVGQEKWSVAFRDRFAELTEALTELSRECAQAVALSGHPVDPGQVQSAFRNLATDLTDETQAATLHQRKDIYRTARHLVEQASALAESVTELKSGSQSFLEPPEARFGQKPKTFDPIAEIRGSISLRSSTFRHALRLGLATAIGGILASLVHIVRGYWIPMTVVIVLKPNFGGTVRRSIQRVTGTVLGALLAAFIMVDLAEPWLLWAVLPGLAFITFASRNYNYTLFSLSLTPMVLLMLDIAHPITPADSFLRVIHTIVGSILALLAGYLLFPTWESGRLPNRIAEALRTEALLVRALRDAMLGIKKRPIAEFRRAAAVAVSNAAATGQRLLSEPPDRRGDVEASLAAVNDCRGILYALAAISDYPARKAGEFESDVLANLLLALAEAWEGLANSLDSGSTPKKLSELPKLLEQQEIAVSPDSTEADLPGDLDADATTGPSLYLHLRNAVNLTLRIRELIARLLRAAPARARSA
jgi:uncharacterized membrane protein YccC